MKTSEDLFYLIKSLTKTEKRYFKRFCLLYSSRKENNYLKLFNAIDKQNVYTEKKILIKFKNDNFIKQIHVTKKYLYTIILKSLRVYNEKSDSKILLKNNVIEADLLARRRLFSQSQRLLKRSLKNALKKEEILDTLFLYKLEKQLTITLSKVDMISKLHQIREKEDLELKKYQEYENYLLIESKLFSILSRWGNQNNQIYRNKYNIELQRLFKNPLMNPMKKQLTLKSRFVYFRIYINYYELTGKNTLAKEKSTHLIKLFEKNNFFRSENLLDYCGVIFNYVYLLLNLNEYDNALYNIKKIYHNLDHPSIKSSKSYYNKLFCGVAELTLYLNNLGGNTKENNVLVDEVIYYLSRLKEKNNYAGIKLIYYNISTHYLIIGRYNESLFWINKILNENAPKSGVNIHIASLVVASLIHYELDNYIYLENLFQKFRLLLKRFELQNVFEKNAISYIYNITNSTSIGEKVNLFKEFKALLNKEIEKDNKESNLLSIVLLSWINSKLFKKTLKEQITIESKKIFN